MSERLYFSGIPARFAFIASLFSHGFTPLNALTAAAIGGFGNGIQWVGFTSLKAAHDALFHEPSSMRNVGQT